MLKKSLIFFCILIKLSLTQAQDQQAECSTCYSAKSTECEQKCGVKGDSNSPGKHAKCKRGCIVTACKEICNYKLSENSGQTSEIINCDYCTRQAQVSCKNKCATEDTQSSCIKICASNTCSKYCSLPISSEDALKNSQTNSNDPIKRCKSCKEASEESCTASCGSGIGSTTCKVVCGEKKCEQACLIE